MDIDNNSKFQLHHQHQPPKQHKYCSILVIIGWILITGTFILCGIFLLLHKTADLSTHVSKPRNKNLFLQSLYKEEQEKSHMTNGNKSRKHTFHSDIQDKDIVEALENEVQYWTDYHPQSLYKYNGFCTILCFVWNYYRLEYT
ncbi:uncharacterized protein LOC114281800 [Camellia sinensis]|uniref:uncharacterized protein LOC114281800 n=1 Tax=Camellia sinensis TaxID=4442 RepID=UPI001036BF53|nr:uncharacterized protein LOC114281800 [Camellia sinensis]